MGVSVPTLQAEKRRFELHPLFVDLGFTAVTSAAVLVTSLVLVSLFGKVLGAVALAEYLLVRRIYSWLQSATLLGVDSALPRYVAMTDARQPRLRDEYLFASIICGAAVTVFMLLLFNGAGTLFSQWLFGEKDLRGLVLALSLFLAGGAAHGIVYGFYRGQLAMNRANILQMINLVAVPLGCALALSRHQSTALIVGAMGLLMIFFSFLFALPLFAQLVRVYWRNIKEPLRTLLQYSVPRLPSIFGFGAMLALGPMLASHRMPLSRVTALLLGMSMLMGISASAEPLGLILLSKVSMFVSQNRESELRTHLIYLQEAVVACYVFICLQLIVFADVLVRAWVGNKVSGDLGVIRLTLVSIPFYLLFAYLRSVVDATSVTPYNTFNILITLALYAAMLGAVILWSPLDDLLWNIALSLVIAIALLGVLTIRTVGKLYALKLDWKRSLAAILLGASLAGVSYGLRLAVGSQLNLISTLVIELFVSAVFVVLLRRIGSPWLPFFWNLAIHRRPANA
jgi:O-antigen/teichoic acid export membrane protein